MHLGRCGRCDQIRAKPTRTDEGAKVGLIDLTLVNSIHLGTTETDIGDQVLTMRARNLGSNDPEPAPGRR